MSNVSTGSIYKQMQAISERLNPKTDKLAQKYTQQIQEVATRIEDIPSECYRANSVLVKQPKSILSKAPRTPLPKD